MFSHQHELQMDNKETECSLTILESDCYEFEELVPLATQRDGHEYIHDVLSDSFEEYVAIGDIYHCNQNIGDLRMDKHSIDSFDIVSNASTDLRCHEDEIVPFENPKDDYQIDTLVGDSLRSTADSKGSPQLSNLQTKAVFNRYEEEGDERKVSDQHLSLYFHLTEEEQSTFSIDISEGNKQQDFSFQLEQQHKEVFICRFDDHIVDYLEIMRSLNIKIFFSREGQFCHLFQLHFY